MHDIALLKQLTEAQLRFVIKNDPLTYHSDISADKMIEKCKEQKIDPKLIDQLLLSWAVQHEVANQNKSAADYYHAYDARKNTNQARDHAIRVGSLPLLLDCESVVWYHIARAADSAMEMKHFDSAFDCFALMHKNALEVFRNVQTIPAGDFGHAQFAFRRAIRGIKSILQCVLCEANLDLVSSCLKILDRDLTQPEKRTLRYCLVTLFIEDKSFTLKDNSREALTAYASDSEKRACLNAVASRGDTQLLQKLSALWDIPLTVHHWKLALGKHWYTQLNGGDAMTRIQIARELVKFSDRYKPLLHKALVSGRADAIKSFAIRRADEIGQEIGQPVTLDELTKFMHAYGNDDRYQETQVPFAIAKMIELVGPVATSEEQPATKYIGSAENCL